MYQKRKLEISYLNSLLCLFVVFIHVISPAINRLDRGTVLYIFFFSLWRIMQVAVPGFLFLSALKYGIKYRDSSVDYLKFLSNRARELLPSYIFFCVLFYLYDLITGTVQFSLFQFIKGVLLGTLASPFYFIVIILQFYILLPPLLKLCKKAPYSTVISSLLIMWGFGLFWGPKFSYSDRFFLTYLGYFILGLVVGLQYHHLQSLLKRYWKYILFFACLTNVWDGWRVYLSFTSQISTPGYDFFHSINVIITILCLFSLMLQIRQSGFWSSPSLHLFDKSTYYIYLSHCLVLALSRQMLFHTQTIWRYSHIFITGFITFVISILGSMCYTAWKQKKKSHRQ